MLQRLARRRLQSASTPMPLRYGTGDQYCHALVFDEELMDECGRLRLYSGPVSGSRTHVDYS